jgi:hypothetical protein
MGGIFISYRREDSADICGRIYDHLVGRYGKGAVFKDVDSIPYGESFPEYIQTKLADCSVCLAVVGQRWLDSAAADGRRRLDDPGDFVRIEIETALQHGLLVIPVLVNGARMPSIETLPVTLAKLTTLNAAQVRVDPDFATDVRRLGDAIEHSVPLHVAAPGTQDRMVGTQHKPSPSPNRRRISPRLIVVGILLLTTLVGSLVLLAEHNASNGSQGYGPNITGTWQLALVLPGGQTVSHTLDLQDDTYRDKITGTISALPNLSLAVTGSITEDSPGVYTAHLSEQDTVPNSQSPTGVEYCPVDLDSTVSSDGSHLVQGTVSGTAAAGSLNLCADMAAQFPLTGATFTATRSA